MVSPDNMTKDRFRCDTEEKIKKLSSVHAEL